MSASKWKPYPSYTESNFDFIPKYPSHWELKRVKYLINEIDGIKIGPFGSSLKLNTLTTDGIKIYGQGNVIKNNFTLGHRHLPVERFKSDFSQYEILDGDVLITMMGTTGKSKVFRKEFKRGIIDSHLIRLRFQKNQFNSDLFVITLQESEYMFNQLKLKSNGSIMEGLNSSIVKDLYVVKPPLGEQKQIERFLHRANEKISRIVENLESQQSLIEQKRFSVITQAVTRGLNSNTKMKETGLKWYPKVPSHWKLRRLKHLASIRPSNVDKKKYDGQGEVRLANYVDVYHNDKITENLDLMVATASENEIAKFSLMSGDLIITKDSESWDDIAVPAFVPETMEGVVCGYHLTLIRPNQEHVLGEFLFRTYQALGIRDQYHYNANGVTRYGLGSYWVNNGVIPVPPFDEQIEIIEYINHQLEIMKGIEMNIINEIERLKQFQTALISAVVTGKIDVRSL